MRDLRDVTRESARHGESAPPRADKGVARWPIYLLLTAAVIVPALFWHGLWLGRRLSDEQILRRLAQPENALEVQHACEQVSRRMQRDPAAAVQFYGPLVSLADHPDEQIRCVVAWCMGEDGTGHRPFQRALLCLVDDEAPQVRYNTALALVRLGEQAARPVLCEMLAPYAVSVEWESSAPEGTVIEILSREDPVRPLMQVALVDTGGDEPERVLAPLGGRIGQLVVGVGQRVTKGRPLCTIQPDFQQIYQALRALSLVGQPEDLEYVQPHLDPDGSFSRAERARLQTQAQLAVEAIRWRQQR